MTKNLILWALPRSRSTVFERIMLERGDFHTLHEPFGPYYYFSAERRSERAVHIQPEPKYGFDVIQQSILDQQERFPIFIKELAYAVAHRVDRAFMGHFTNTFLIRDPAQLLPSLYDKWQDFTLEEAGYAPLYQLLQWTQEFSDSVPIVIDADDLLEHPTATMQAYCNAVGIPFLSDAMQWKPGPRPEFNWWEGGSWHEDLNASTEVKKNEKKSYLSINANETLKTAYAACLPFYQKMASHRLAIESFI